MLVNINTDKMIIKKHTQAGHMDSTFRLESILLRPYSSYYLFFFPCKVLIPQACCPFKAKEIIVLGS